MKIPIHIYHRPVFKAVWLDWCCYLFNVSFTPSLGRRWYYPRTETVPWSAALADGPSPFLLISQLLTTPAHLDPWIRSTHTQHIARRYYTHSPEPAYTHKTLELPPLYNHNINPTDTVPFIDLGSVMICLPMKFVYNKKSKPSLEIPSTVCSM